MTVHSSNNTTPKLPDIELNTSNMFNSFKKERGARGGVDHRACNLTKKCKTAEEGGGGGLTLTGA